MENSLDIDIEYGKIDDWVKEIFSELLEIGDVYLRREGERDYYFTVNRRNWTLACQATEEFLRDSLDVKSVLVKLIKWRIEKEMKEFGYGEETIEGEGIKVRWFDLEKDKVQINYDSGPCWFTVEKEDAEKIKEGLNRLLGEEK